MLRVGVKNCDTEYIIGPLEYVSTDSSSLIFWAVRETRSLLGPWLSNYFHIKIKFVSKTDKTVKCLTLFTEADAETRYHAVSSPQNKDAAYKARNVWISPAAPLLRQPNQEFFKTAVTKTTFQCIHV